MMTATLLLLSLPMDLQKKPAATPPAAKATRLRRKTDAPPAKPAEAKDKAPEVESRPNIPRPDEPAPKDELDQKLLEELGQNDQPQDENPLLRAGRRMRQSEQRLAKSDTSDQTIELQRQIVADLDELLKRPPSSPPPSKKASKKQQSKSNKQMAAKKQQAPDQSTGSRPANRPGPARASTEDLGHPKEVKDIWGHLSAQMRDEMSQYAKESFLEKYRDLLEQYYSTIAAQSRVREVQP